FYLVYFVAILMAMAGLGVRLWGPRLIAFSMMIFFGLSHIRGLLMFFLLAPVILARPIVASAPWFGAVRRVDGESSQSARASDPVLFYLQERSFALFAISLAIAAAVTIHSWHKINSGPPKSISPSDAIEFVHRNGITGNVFNSFSFGGY